MIERIIRGWRLTADDLRHNTPLRVTFGVAVLAFLFSLSVAFGFHL